MGIYAILDTNVGLLQWLGEASEEGEAYDSYAHELGADSYDLLQSTEIFHLTPDEAKEVKAWHEAGEATQLTPDCISHYPRRKWGR